MSSLIDFQIQNNCFLTQKFVTKIEFQIVKLMICNAHHSGFFYRNLPHREKTRIGMLNGLKLLM
jgi:hypothetical protein